MSFESDIVSALPALRSAAEALHRDTFTVYRATGEMITDPETLVEAPVFATVAASVAGKFQFPNTEPGTVQTPGQVAAASAFTWHTSVTVLGILTDDEVECVAVDPETGDPDLVGLRVRITGPFLKSIATARRFPVEEVS